MPLPTNIQNILNDPQYQADIKLLGGSLSGGTAEKNLAARRVEDTEKRIRGEIDKLGLSSPFSSQFLSGALQPFGSGQFLSADEFSGNVQPFGRENFANLFGSPKAAAEYVLGGGQFENLNIPRTQLSTGGFGGGQSFSVPTGSTFQVNPQGVVLKRGDKPALTAEQFAAFQDQPRNPFSSPGASQGQQGAIQGVYRDTQDNFFVMENGQRRKIELPEFKSLNINETFVKPGEVVSLQEAVGGPSARSQSPLSPQLQTLNQGLVSTGQLPQEQALQQQQIQQQVQQTDDIVSRIMSSFEPTQLEKDVQSQIDKLNEQAEVQGIGFEMGINEILDQPIPQPLLVGQSESLQRQYLASERNTLRKIAGLQTQLERLGDNREGQLRALEFALNAKRQSAMDALNMFKALAPERVMTDEKTGTIYFANLDGTITSKKLPGFQPQEAGVDRTVDLGDRIALLDAQGNTIRVLSKGLTPSQQVPTGVSPEQQVEITDNINLVNSIINNPNLGAVTGLSRFGTALQPQYQLVKNQVEQLQSLLSLENRQKLKGSGAISDYESKVLATSATSLNVNLADEDFKKELRKIKAAFATASGQSVPVLVLDPKTRQSKIGILDRNGINSAISQGFIVEYQ